MRSARFLPLTLTTTLIWAGAAMVATAELETEEVAPLLSPVSGDGSSDSLPGSIDLASLLGLKHLSLEPQILTGTDETDTTAGLGYEYDRNFTDEGFEIKSAELVGQVHSDGVFVADISEASQVRFTHKVGLRLIDVVGMFEEPEPYAADIAPDIADLMDRWQDARDDWVDKDENCFECTREMKEIEEEAIRLFEHYGGRTNQPLFDRANANWPGIEQAVFPRRASDRFHVSLGIDGGAETDQKFSDGQWLGTVSLEGQIEHPWLDTPFWLLFGDRDFDWPYSHPALTLWVDASLIDPTENDAYKTIAGEDDNYGRVGVGAYYQTVLVNLGDTSPEDIGIELEYQFHHQFDAPAGVEDANLDETHYYRIRALLPYGSYVEYAGGRLPLDIDKEQAVRVGWSHEFGGGSGD